LALSATAASLVSCTLALVLAQGVPATLDAQAPFDSTRALQEARRLAAQRESWPQAAVAFDALLQAAPGYALAWTVRSEFEQSRGAEDAAERAVARALELAPRSARALVQHGNLILRRDPARARQDFLAAAEADGQWAVPPERVAVTYVREQDCTQARPWYQRALRMDPDFFEARMVLEACVPVVQRAAAIGELIAEAPSLSLYQWRLSLPESALSSESRLRDLEAILRLIRDPADPVAIYAQLKRAEVYQRMGERQKVVDAMSAVIAAVSSRPDSLGADGRSILQGAVMRRAYAEADAMRYDRAVADFALVDRTWGDGTAARLDEQMSKRRTGIYVERVLGGAVADVRMIVGTPLDTTQYRRFEKAAAEGLGTALLRELEAVAKAQNQPSLGLMLLYVAAAVGTGSRPLLPSMASTIRSQLRVVVQEKREPYERYVDDAMARLLISDLALPVGWGAFCDSSGRIAMGFYRASFNERVEAPGRPLLRWTDRPTVSDFAWGTWVYEPAERRLLIGLPGAAPVQWTVTRHLLTGNGRTLQACRR
jgi:Tfp pilus assembly protein PilF